MNYLPSRSFAVIAIFVAMAIMTTTAKGRLGETTEQCAARYGRVIATHDTFRPDFPQSEYQKNTVHIRIRFLKGTAGQLIISADGAIPAKEILEANTQGSQWVVDKTAHVEEGSKEFVLYKRADGKATAKYVVSAASGLAILTVETVEFRKAFDAPASGF